MGFFYLLRHFYYWPLFCFMQCTPVAESYTTLKGETFGTYYSIRYKSDRNFKREIDSLLFEYSSAVSKYDPSSELSEFNRTGRVTFKRPYLRQLVEKAKQIHLLTQGAMDPTVMPLVEAWGFGTQQQMRCDSLLIDSLLSYVDFNAISIQDSVLLSSKSGIHLDLNAVGEGFGIDLIGDWLARKGVSDFKVEIGGEVLCRGVNDKNKPWRIAIENPEYESKGAERVFAIIGLENEAISTSGSYRHFFTDSAGVRHPHIIDPRTGYPVRHNLLSVTVKAKDCTTADGFATAIMVLGAESGKELIERTPGLEAFFIYDSAGVPGKWVSQGFAEEPR